ncbi:MAG: hypothetical protein M0036_18050 [Desulfobacteraceae bacterium]|nr:hypothetical protein [Desulfobacteraceae bacterium]
MAQIVRLTEYRQRNRAQAGFKLWRRTFDHDFDATMRLNDLSPEVLCRLAEPAEASTRFFYSLILGFLGYGENAVFELLENTTRILVVDIHLFLADQVRFEMMRRMGWLSRFSATQYHLLDMVLEFEHVRALCHQDPPQLSATHPGYEEYKGLIRQDQQVFIRRLLPACLEEFKREFLG